MVSPQSSRVKTGETVQFTCIASGSPSPDLTWRKVNGSLPVSSTVQRGVLKIANVTQKDAGSYNCEAKNVEGSANRSGILEIKGKVSKGRLFGSNFTLTSLLVSCLYFDEFWCQNFTVPFLLYIFPDAIPTRKATNVLAVMMRVRLGSFC